MPALTGKGGNVTYGGGHVASIGSWSIDVDTNMHDITPFTTSATKWREFAAGLSGWTGSIDAVGFDAGSTGQGDLIAATLTPVSAAAEFELDQTVGGKLTGSIFLSGGSFGAEIDGLTNASFAVQGTGACAFSTST